MRNRRTRLVALALIGTVLVMAAAGYLSVFDYASDGTDVVEPGVTVIADHSASIGAPQPFQYSKPARQ